MINLRENLLSITNKLLAAGLNHGATGNCSCRDRDGFLITPTGVDSSKLTADMMVRMNLSDGSLMQESKYNHQVSGNFIGQFWKNIQKLMQSFIPIRYLRVH